MTHVSNEHAKIRLTWAPVAGAAGYIVEQKRVKLLAPDVWDRVNPAIATTNEVVTATITVSDPGKTFTHRVRARNAHGESSASNEVATQARDERPAEPTNLRYNFIPGNRGIWFAWDPANGANAYEVEVSDSNTFSQASFTRTESTSVNLTGLRFEKKYYLRVIARNQHGETISDRYIRTTRLPEPNHWWGHQADHKVKFVIDKSMTNNVVINSIAPAAYSWNKAIETINKNLLICILCNDDFTVTVKTVNNNNDSKDDITFNHNEGCGTSYACVKQVGAGGINNSTDAPGMHMENMYIVIEDPPITAGQDEFGEWHYTEYEWTSDLSKENEKVPCLSKEDSCPERKYAYIDRVMLHELGHTLGLGDFYTDKTMISPEGVMHNNNEIMDEDIDQLRAIYFLHTSH